MILYLDTSAFLTLYLDEPGSEATLEAINRASLLCTHLITYAEMCAALAMAQRLNRVSAREREVLKKEFDRDWSSLQTITTDMALVKRAGDLATNYGLRGYDSVHLACAERTASLATDEHRFIFAAFDRKLLKAAEALGLPVR